jgi:hypothetical protein
VLQVSEVLARLRNKVKVARTQSAWRI